MSEVKVLFKQGNSLGTMQPGEVLVLLEKYYSRISIHADEVTYILSWKVGGELKATSNPHYSYTTIAEQDRRVISLNDIPEFNDALAIRCAIAKYDELTIGKT